MKLYKRPALQITVQLAQLQCCIDSWYIERVRDMTQNRDALIRREETRHIVDKQSAVYINPGAREVTWQCLTICHLLGLLRWCVWLCQQHVYLEIYSLSRTSLL